MRCVLLENCRVWSTDRTVGCDPYINPAPPVIIMFLTSGNGSYLVLPVKTGASFHTPKSSKNLFAPGFEEAGAAKG